MRQMKKREREREKEITCHIIINIIITLFDLELSKVKESNVKNAINK